MLVTTDNGVVAVSPEARGVRLTGTPSSAGEEFTIEFSQTPVDSRTGGELCKGSTNS